MRTTGPEQRGVFRLRAMPPGRYVTVAVEALEQGTEWDPEVEQILRLAGPPVHDD